MSNPKIDLASELLSMNVAREAAATNPESIRLVGRGLIDVARQSRFQARRDAGLLYGWSLYMFTTNSKYAGGFTLDSVGDPTPHKVDGSWKRSALHPAIFGKYRWKIGDEEWSVSGWYLILVMLCHATSKGLVEAMRRAAVNREPIPGIAVAEAGLADAERDGIGSGIYDVHFLPNHRMVIGQTCRPYAVRMKEYRSGKYLTKWLEKPEDVTAFKAYVVADLSKFRMSSYVRAAVTLAMETMVISMCASNDPRYGGNTQLFDNRMSLDRPAPISSLSWLKLYKAVWRWVSKYKKQHGRPPILSTAEEWWLNTFSNHFEQSERGRLHGSTMRIMTYNIHRQACYCPELGLPDLGEVWPRGIPWINLLYAERYAEDEDL